MITRKNVKQKLSEKLLGNKLTGALFTREMRDRLEMTQTELAKKIGVPKSIICDIEKGRRLISGKMAIKLAEALDCSASYVFEIAKRDEAKKLGIKIKVA